MTSLLTLSPAHTQRRLSTELSRRRWKPARRPRRRSKRRSIGNYAFYVNTKLTGLDLSQAASLESIGIYAFLGTDITATIVTPFNVPTYNAANSFPSSVTIVKG